MKQLKLRLGMGICAAVLLLTEILIGMFAHGWVRHYLGDVLVVILIYTLWRTVLPEKPAYGWKLPCGILLFALCVELLQLWGFCDRLHITDPLLRIIIGTGFSYWDCICYAVGILPCAAAEYVLQKPK